MNDTMLNINCNEEKPSNLKTMEVLLKKCAPMDGGDITDNEDNNANSLGEEDNEASTATPSTSSEQLK